MAVSARVSGTARGIDVPGLIGEAVASPGIRSVLDDCARRCGFRAYSPDSAPGSRSLAISALNAFLSTGSVASAEAAIRNGHDAFLDIAAEVDAIRDAGILGSLAEGITRDLLARFDGLDPAAVARAADLALAAMMEGRIAAMDDSSPLDLIGDEEVVVCYVPGTSDGVSLADGLTRFRGFGSDAMSIEPDESFARFLRLVNVSSDEYVDMVHRLRGSDLREFPEWRSFRVESDPSRERLLDDEQVLEGIDGAIYGFNPLLAFKVGARHLIERDWEQPLSVTGGIVGLHNFTNGSGDPQRFEATVMLDARPRDFIIGEGRPCDFEEAYGWVPKAFDSRVADGHEPAMAAPAP